MKKMDKQTFWAGLVGIIALIAISCELTFGGVSTTSVSAAIKDLMGIAIDVMVFIVAIKIATRKAEDEPIETKLGNALDKWRSENSKGTSSAMQKHKRNRVGLCAFPKLAVQNIWKKLFKYNSI